MSTDPLAEACCGHALRWHEAAGCGFYGYAAERRCPCLLNANAALSAHDAQVRADERQKVAARLADEGTVEKVAEALAAHQLVDLYRTGDEQVVAVRCTCRDFSTDQFAGLEKRYAAHLARAALDVIAGLIGGEDE